MTAAVEYAHLFVSCACGATQACLCVTYQSLSQLRSRLKVGRAKVPSPDAEESWLCKTSSSRYVSTIPILRNALTPAASQQHLVGKRNWVGAVAAEFV